MGENWLGGAHASRLLTRVSGEEVLQSVTHLSHVLKVVVSLLQGSSSVQRLAHAGVLAEEGLTVVLDPVHHLEGEEEPDNDHRHSNSRLPHHLAWLVGSCLS